MKRTQYENLSIPNKIEGGEPTLLQAEILAFDNGERIGVFAEHPENQGPKLSEIRTDLVNGIHDAHNIQPGQLRYMEKEPSMGEAPYREFSFQPDEKGKLTQREADVGHTQTQFDRLVGIHEKQEQSQQGKQEQSQEISFDSPNWAEGLKMPDLKPKM